MKSTDKEILLIKILIIFIILRILLGEVPVRRTPSERWPKGTVCLEKQLNCVEMGYVAYILKSLKDGRYYYGSCENLEERLKKHNSGGVKATKYRTPFVIHYFEEFATRSEAFGREQFFKGIDGYNWLKERKII